MALSGFKPGPLDVINDYGPVSLYNTDLLLFITKAPECFTILVGHQDFSWRAIQELLPATAQFFLVSSPRYRRYFGLGWQLVPVAYIIVKV